MIKHFFRKYIDLDFKVSALSFFRNILCDSSVRSFVLEKYPYFTYSYDTNIKVFKKLERELFSSLLDLRRNETTTFSLKDFINE